MQLKKLAHGKKSDAAAAELEQEKKNRKKMEELYHKRLDDEKVMIAQNKMKWRADLDE